ncbi:hypothetical protein K1719_006844 [Acacia pycnantha]|nr:hypothetical protein K1719_006844 [Acacia pycnantha]
MDLREIETEFRWWDEIDEVLSLSPLSTQKIISRSMREHSRRSRRRSDDSESLSLSGESDSHRSSSRRSRSRRRSSKQDTEDSDERGHGKKKSSRTITEGESRRRSSKQDTDDSDERGHGKKKSSRTITEGEIQEYLAKKAQKKAMKVAKKLKTHTVSGYSNDSNPFGDSNLNEIFVWRKKIERDVSQGVQLDSFSVKAEKKRQRERMAEIEKVKKRREERALEKARHEEEMAILARERARAEFQDWEKKEEEFHFDQSKVRSEIRLLEGRAKPIDILTKHLSGSDDLDIEINEPYMVFKGLTVKEMEELRDDIKMHLDLDRRHQPIFQKFVTDTWSVIVAPGLGNPSLGIDPGSKILGLEFVVGQIGSELVGPTLGIALINEPEVVVGDLKPLVIRPQAVVDLAMLQKPVLKTSAHTCP